MVRFQDGMLGHAGYLVGPRGLIDEGSQHENVDSLEVLFRVHQARAVFEPDFPVVNEGAFPLFQGGGEVEHTLAWDRHVFEIPAGRGRLKEHHPFDSRLFASLFHPLGPAWVPPVRVKADAHRLARRLSSHVGQWRWRERGRHKPILLTLYRMS